MLNDMRYAPDRIILELRPEVKVTVTPKLCGPKMYLNTKFGIPPSNNIGDKIILELSQGHSDSKMVHNTLLPEDAFGIPTSNII